MVDLSYARRTIVTAAIGEPFFVKRTHSGTRGRAKADMRFRRLPSFLRNPKLTLATDAEANKGNAAGLFGAHLPNHAKAQRRQHCLVESFRPIQIGNAQGNVVECKRNFGLRKKDGNRLSGER